MCELNDNCSTNFKDKVSSIVDSFHGSTVSNNNDDDDDDDDNDNKVHE